MKKGQHFELARDTLPEERAPAEHRLRKDQRPDREESAAESRQAPLWPRFSAHRQGRHNQVWVSVCRCLCMCMYVLTRLTIPTFLMISSLLSSHAINGPHTYTPRWARCLLLFWVYMYIGSPCWIFFILLWASLFASISCPQHGWLLFARPAAMGY